MQNCSRRNGDLFAYVILCSFGKFLFTAVVAVRSKCKAYYVFFGTCALILDGTALCICHIRTFQNNTSGFFDLIHTSG